MRAADFDVSAVSQWAVNPDRTTVVSKESDPGARIVARRLEPSGRAVTSTPIWSADQCEDWNILGWAAAGIVTLWRREDGHSLLRFVDDSGGELTRCRVVGRPVECRIGRAGRIEVLVAVSVKSRPLLCLHHPDVNSYRPLEGTQGLRAVGSWNERILVVNYENSAGEPAVQLLTYDEHEHTELDVMWPTGMRAVNAVGQGGDIVGLTGTDESGRTLPGLLDLSRGRVRWFGQHDGYSSVGIAPSGRRLLVATWADQQYMYRVLDPAGEQVGQVRPGAGIATDLSFTADERHVLCWYQSPARPRTIARWNVSTNQELTSWDDPEPTLAMRWRHRWAGDGNGRALPEWLFEPENGGHGGVVLHLHGGPRSRLNQVYEPVIAALVDSGWTVIGMNYPGSSGYSAEYRDLPIGDWGGADVAAIEGRLRALRTEVGTFPVCLYGQSYGAYLALLAASVGLVDSVAVWAPITDLPLLLESVDGIQGRWLDAELGDLRLAPQRLRERSPVNRALALSESRLLIGHSSGDERCPVEQSRRLVQVLGSAPRSTGFLRYVEDPHGSHAPSEWRWWAEAVVAHYQQSLLVADRSAGP